METEISDLYFKPVTTERELKACYAMRYKVYCEQKRWLPAHRYPDGLEMDEYDDKATHIIAMDEDFNIVGSVRLLPGNNYDKLPYRNHPIMKKMDVHINNEVEFSRFIITARKNRYEVTNGILRTVYQTCKNNDWINWVSLIEHSLIRFMERFNWYLKPLCSPAKYYGGITVPTICSIFELEKIWLKSFPDVYAFYQGESSLYADNKELLAH